MRESVDEEEQDVGDGEGAAGVKGAILPGAPSCQEESSHVDLRPEGGKQEELHCPNLLYLSRFSTTRALTITHSQFSGVQIIF